MEKTGMLNLAYIVFGLGVDALANETALASGLPTYKAGIVDVVIDNSAEMCYFNTSCVT
jgi:hypothetical protein